MTENNFSQTEEGKSQAAKLLECRRKLGFRTAKEFFEKYGRAKDGERFSYSQYQKYESGERLLGSKAANLYAKIFNVSAEWLVSKDKNIPHIVGTTTIAEKITSILAKDEVIITMIDATACCGDGIDNLPEKTCGHWRLPIAEFKSITSSNPENLRMLRVQGDSMMPTIEDGDWVWVDISNNFIGSDGIYLIRMATGLAVKRLQSGLSNVVIKSDNYPTYSDITADVGEVKIIGKVVYILKGRRV